MKESDIQKEIMQYLKAKNIYHWRSPNLTIRRRKNIITKGVSDILGFYKDKFLAIEVKKPGGVQSEDQKDFHNEVKKHGHLAVVAYSLDDVIRFLGLC